jgi:excisionase family DNA binding protein
MSKSKIYYLIQKQELPHIKMGRNVRIRQNELIDWLTNYEVRKPVMQGFFMKKGGA